MKQSHALIVLALLIGSALTSCLHGYSTTKNEVESDMRHALLLTMQEQPSNVITADTIRVFNSHLQMEQLRGRATLAVGTQQPHFEFHAQCSEATILALSDQRPTAVLFALAAAWLLVCIHVRRTRGAEQQGVVLGVEPVLPEPSHVFGGLSYSAGTFTTVATGQEVHLTPMQHQLMELFFSSPRHTLSKAEICEALWPKKEDASDTLYTLIRRLKPIVEQHSQLQIASDRGRAYQLTIRQIGA